MFVGTYAQLVNTHTHTFAHTQSFDDSNEYFAEVTRRNSASARDASLGVFQFNKESECISVKVNAESAYTCKSGYCQSVIQTYYMHSRTSMKEVLVKNENCFALHQSSLECA